VYYISYYPPMFETRCPNGCEEKNKEWLDEWLL
jgi:hypothetical protein